MKISVDCMSELRFDLLGCFRILILCFLALGEAAAEDRVVIQEVDRDRVIDVVVAVQVDGKLKIPESGNETRTLPLGLRANHRYKETLLPAAGPDARVWRAARLYSRADSELTVDGKPSRAVLPGAIQFLVAEGYRHGLEFYHPLSLLRREDLELLNVPGDPLTLLAMLPREPVAAGEKWNVDDWVVQMLADIDVNLDSKFECELTSLTSDEARIDFRGAVRGAVSGAAAKLELSGHLLFDRGQALVKSVELRQSEERRVGVVSPGLDVEAVVTWTRSVGEQNPDLSAARLAQIPADPRSEQLELVYRTPWAAEFQHSRSWHVFHQTPQMLILRLVDEGRLVSQCNLIPVRAARAGKHTSPEQFQVDIRNSLGKQFEKFISAEVVPSPPEAPEWVYRVVVEGTANGKKLNWIYYLCAAGSGQQVSLVFAVDAENLERFGDTDMDLVSSLRLVSPVGQPTSSVPDGPAAK